MDDIKNIMNFYKRFDLINNSNFKNRDYDNLKFGDIELVFYFGGYNFEMEDNEILKYPIDTHIFLKVVIYVMDVVESIEINMYYTE